ncbi:MAG: CPBP family glutamic-type intramembrane protease [Gemmatimonadaceae bacterium]
MTTPLSAGKGGYFASSRAPRYSILFALPLLILYEGLAALLETPEGGMRNGADALFRGAFSAAAGVHGPVIFMTAIVLLGVGLVARDMRRQREPLRGMYFLGMSAESVLLAIAFGLVIGTVTAQLLGAVNLMAVGAPVDLAQMPWSTRLMLSLGAGLYEELFFRVVVVSGLTALGAGVLGWSKRTAVLVAVVVSAFVFSAFHYIPPYGDQLEIASFTFRFLSGLAFSVLYVVRGFGITAWTHALYDVFVLLF